MIKVNPEELRGLVPRMLELTSRTTPWHRRDWRAGTLELVEEAVNEAQIPGTKKEALKELHAHMTNALGSDSGVSSAQKKIIECLKNVDPSSDANSHNVRLAEHHAHDIKKSYILNWADLLDSPNHAKQLDVEGTAKRIISHLLYCGIPPASIYNAIYDRKVDPEVYELSFVLRDLDKRINYAVKDFSFAVPMDRAPDFLYGANSNSEWLKAKELKQWKKTNAPQAESVRHHGGFIITVKARDVNEAAAEAQRQLSQLSFKFHAGSENRFSILPNMWSKENGNSFPTRRRAQSLKLRAFQRAGTLPDLEISTKVRNILAIMEPLQTNDSHVAVVNGWVAIESLLVDSGEIDRIGAERIACVVAASYFRTEMTWLARNYSKIYRNVSPVADQISKSVTSMERSKLLAKLILEEANFDLLDSTDQLAIQKMRVALQEPAEVFDRTFTLLKREFQRLYRKRNLIVHSGRVIENGIDSIAEKTVPLLITGIDQLLIATIQHGLDPKALAALVKFKSLHLTESGNSKSYSILDLLEVE